MKKTIKKLLLLLTIFSLLICGCNGKSNSDSKNKKTLRVGTNAEFAPFEYINDDGECDGFDIGLIKAILSEAGYDCEVVNMEFKSLIGSLTTGGIDVTIAGMTITDERKQSVDFSTPYYTATQCIIVPIGSDITSLDDLNGKKVAVQEGTTGDLIVTPSDTNEIITDKNTVVKQFKKASDATVELLNGGVDAVVIDSSPAKKIVAANESKLTCFNDTSEEEYAIAVAKGNSELLDAINKGLETVKENGTYDELVDKYINNESTTKTYEKTGNVFFDFINKCKFVFVDTNGYIRLLNGLWVTLYISFLAVILGVILGFIVAFMRLSKDRRGKNTVASVIAGIYIDIIRGTPAVVQLLIMYMVIFQSKLGTVAAVVTFGINSGAYVSEIIRAGITAVDKGQMEGGRSLGFSYFETMKYIIIPQAIKNILPALGNEFITLIKETAIVGYVAIADLTKASDFIISRTYETFLPLLAIAIIYYLIVKILTKCLAIFERRLRRSDIR